MKSNLLLEQLEFREPYLFAESLLENLPLSVKFMDALQEPHPFAQPTLADNEDSILSWILKPDESIIINQVPSSPFYMLVLKGSGMVASGDEPEQEFGPNTLLIFESNEALSMRAIDEEMIVVGFLQTLLIAEPG